MFHGLSVFRGGFAREAAQRVVGASLRELMGLNSKSLPRQCAGEKLSAEPEAQAVAWDRHCGHYTAVSQHQEADLTGSNAAEALVAIRGEIGNVRAAWRCGVTQAKLEEIQRGLNGLSRFYLFTGPFQEGEILVGMAVPPFFNSVLLFSTAT